MRGAARKGGPYREAEGTRVTHLATRCPTDAPVPRNTGRAQGIARQLCEPGVILPGSITERMMRGGKRTRRWKADLPRLHGLCIQWTRTVNVKTATKFLTAEQLELHHDPHSTTRYSYGTSSPGSRPSPSTRSMRPKGGGHELIEKQTRSR